MTESISQGAALCEEKGIGALTLGAYLQQVVQQYGDREAALIRDDQSAAVESWSYQELWARSVQVARSLAACGVGKGTRVGLLMTNRLEFLSGLFGTALAGGVATPISTFFTGPELAVVLKESCCSVLLLERSVLKKDFVTILQQLEPKLVDSAPGPLFSSRFPYLRYLAQVDTDTAVGAIDGWQGFLSRASAVPEVMMEGAVEDVVPSDPGVLFFSSGSTGKAKGILSSHRAVCLQLWRWSRWYNIQQAPRTWSANGFFFSGNFSMALGGTLSSGGALVLQRYFDAEAALALMAAEGVTMPLAWPHQWAQLQAAANYNQLDLSALHYVDKDSPLQSHPSVDSSWSEPQQAYGSTEAFTLISVLPSGDAMDAAAKASHGLPTAGTVIKIVDPTNGAILPRGETGEIIFKGPTLMLGYIGVPLDETLDAEGFFHTNDSGYLDDAGRLHWLGRLNDIIKTGGANVSPLEIDGVIRQCPGVKLNQTVGVPDELLGEKVVTCVVAHQGAELSEASIRSFASQQLASFKLPRMVVFVEEEALKTTGSAKIKTQDLRELVARKLA